ncbi:MAG: hypothetical protein KI785_10265 [Devosiaceae bacterium]|nr:hypothetical protein [Devosiaceae bacterium MH13]
MTDLRSSLRVAGEADTERRAAIAFVLEAFDAAREAGIGDQALSRAALFQAIMQIVDELGEEGAARFLLTSARGVERGYYTRCEGPARAIN